MQPYASSADIVSSLGQSTEDVEDSDNVGGDPPLFVTFHQTHSSFVDIKVYLLCFCAENDTEPLYDQLEQLETELLKAHNNSSTKRFITDYAVKQ